jgi:hypothetical protein
MTNSSKGVLISVCIVALVLAVWAISYHTFEFRGGIGVRDSGFLSYPRYHAEVGEVPFWKDGDYQFTVKGLPSGPLDLSLQMPDMTSNNVTELTSLSTFMSVSISEASGHVLCSANGKLSDAKLRGNNGWVLASSSAHAGFWHPSCQQLPISRFKTYTVKLSFAAADPHSPHSLLQAVLQGGGN